MLFISDSRAEAFLFIVGPRGTERRVVNLSGQRRTRFTRSPLTAIFSLLAYLCPRDLAGIDRVAGVEEIRYFSSAAATTGFARDEFVNEEPTASTLICHPGRMEIGKGEGGILSRNGGIRLTNIPGGESYFPGKNREKPVENRRNVSVGRSLIYLGREFPARTSDSQ